MKTWPVVSISLLSCSKAAMVVISVWGVLTFQSFAGTVVFGIGGTQALFPFAITNAGTPWYLGQYQLIYDGDRFPGPSAITQIAFKGSGSAVAASITYNLSIGFAVTERNSDSPGSDFVSGIVPAFSGSTTALLTAETNDFDLKFDLTTPFLYDPALGNLLFDVTMFSASGPQGLSAGRAFRADDLEGSMAELYLSNGSVQGFANYGPITQFTVNPVPEPAMAGMVLLGAVMCIRRRRVPF